MKFFAVAALFTSVLAAPALEDRTNGSYQPCPSGLFSQPRCCATDVLGLACLDGDVRKYSLFVFESCIFFFPTNTFL